MRRFGSLLLGLVLGALALGPAAALPPTRSTNTGAVPDSRTISAGTGLSGGGSLAANRTLSLATAGPGAATYCGGGQYVTSVVLDAYGRTTTVNCATPSSSPAVLVIGSLTGVATTQTYLNSSTTSSTGTTAEGNALEVIVPSGAVIQVRTAVTTAITSGQQCDTYIKTATTPGGTLTTRATNTFTNADGANVAKLSSTYTTASVVYVAVSALCTFSYAGLIYFTAERVS